MDAYLSKPIQSKALYEMVEGIAVTARINHDEPAGTGSIESISEAIMDWGAAVDRVGGREDLLKQMVALFFKETDKQVPALREAIAQQDMAKVRRVAHSIKGSASCFAAPPVVAAAVRLEFMGRDGALTGADEAYAVLERELDRLKQALMTFVPGSQLPLMSEKK